VRPDVPEPLAEAIDGALQRELGRRHASMRALAQALVVGAIMSGITLPEQLTPVGLPDYALWRQDAQRRALARPLRPVEATHELSMPRTASGRPIARSKRPFWLALLLLLALSGLGWLSLGRTPEVPRAAPRAADLAAPEPERAPTQGQEPTVMQIAPTPAPEAGTANKDGSATPKPSALPGAALKAPAPETRHGTPGDPRRKPKAHAPRPPAEVETEWK
jgi:hypothetical protein